MDNIQILSRPPSPSRTLGVVDARDDALKTLVETECLGLLFSRSSWQESRVPRVLGEKSGKIEKALLKSCEGAQYSRSSRREYLTGVYPCFLAETNGIFPRKIGR